jgi:xeroderma pigmentosum group C-complementing protein
LTSVDDIVQPFHLPKAQYPVLNPSPTASADKGHPEEEEEARLPKVLLYNFEALDDYHDLPFDEHQCPPRAPLIGAPKTMREMAEEAARLQVGDQATEWVAIEGSKGHSSPSPRTQTHEKDTRSTRSTPILEGKAALRSTRASGAKKRKRKEVISSAGDDRKPSSRKRGRDGNAEGTAPPTPTARVLRPRIPKNTAQMEEEEARE